MGIAAGFCLETPSSVHRFLISGPDFRINARKPSRTAQRLHRFLISGSDLRIDVSFSPETASCVYRFLISRPDLRIAAAPSLLQLKTARLQRSRGVQAGTGCHEGGIILSKKPPEWHLPLPQPSHSNNLPRPILFFVAAKENGPPAAQSWDAGRDRMPRRRHNPK